MRFMFENGGHFFIVSLNFRGECEMNSLRFPKLKFESRFYGLQSSKRHTVSVATN